MVGIKSENLEHSSRGVALSRKPSRVELGADAHSAMEALEWRYTRQRLHCLKMVGQVAVVCGLIFACRRSCRVSADRLRLE